MTKTAAETRWATRQQQAGATIRRETSRIVLQAAAQEFADQGYAAATIRRIAERAEVSVQSVYSTWGSKRDLLRGVMEAALTGDPQEGLADTSHRVWSEAVDEGAAPDVVLTNIAREFTAVSKVASVGWLTYLDAVGTDQGIAADWQRLMDLRRVAFASHLRPIPDTALRAGLTRQTAIDTAWAIASPQTYELMVRRAGYPLAEYETWVRETLCAAILGPPEPAPAQRRTRSPRGKRAASPR